MQGVGSANERQHYIVMPSLIGLAYTQKYPWNVTPMRMYVSI